jgi:hypothetical protein
LIEDENNCAALALRNLAGRLEIWDSAHIQRHDQLRKLHRLRDLAVRQSVRFDRLQGVLLKLGACPGTVFETTEKVCGETRNRREGK